MNGRKPTWLDGAILLACMAAVALAFWAARTPRGGSRRLVVAAGGKEFVYPLDRDGTYRAEGPLGESVIVVEGGRARFRDSPCPNKTCVQAGSIGAGGDWTACLPNDVFIRVEADAAGGMDAVAF